MKHRTQNKRRGTDINTKTIMLDKITKDFLKNFRAIRKKLGLTQNAVAQAVGLKRETIHDIENGVIAPSLKVYVKLAEFMKVDISASINYKFFHGKIDTKAIRKAIRAYGLSFVELSQITGYSAERISLSVRLKPEASIRCLHAVLQVIHKERVAAAFRDTLTHTKGSAARLSVLETDNYYA